MFNLSISPPHLEIILKPGTTITQAYQVTNNSDQTVFLDTSVKPWIPTDTTGSLTYQDVISNPHVKFSLTNADLKIGQTFKIPPNSHQQLVLKIKTDPNTPLHDSYYTFFISQANIGVAASDKPINQARIGTHILISTSNTETPPANAHINNFFVKPTIKDSFFSHLTVNAQIDNLSDHLFKTQGTLVINKNNQEIQKFDIYPHNTLAHHSRDLACALYFDQQKQPPRPAPCTLKPPFWPGKYTATLTLNLSDQTTSQSVNFYIFPYTILTTLIILSALFFLFKKFLPKPLALTNKPKKG